jgi:hypothetical protein
MVPTVHRRTMPTNTIASPVKKARRNLRFHNRSYQPRRATAYSVRQPPDTGHTFWAFPRPCRRFPMNRQITPRRCPESAQRTTTRKPMLLFRFSGSLLFRFAARQFLALLFQEPPRKTRDDPEDEGTTLKDLMPAFRPHQALIAFILPHKLHPTKHGRPDVGHHGSIRFYAPP